MAPGAEHVHVISVDPSHVLNAFDPEEALGAGIDGHEKGEVARLLSPANVAAMLSAGLKPLTYRLRTDSLEKCGIGIPMGLGAIRYISMVIGYRMPHRPNRSMSPTATGFPAAAIRWIRRTMTGIRALPTAILRHSGRVVLTWICYHSGWFSTWGRRLRSMRFAFDGERPGRRSTPCSTPSRTTSR